MSKKKILIFIDWYLPGYKAGGPIQSVANLVENLKDEFDFSIITRDTDYCESRPYPNVKSDEWNILPDGIKVYYFSKEQLTRSNLKNLIRKTPFDVVYLNGIFSFYFTLIPLYYLRKKNTKPLIIAARGMFASSAMNIKKKKKQLFFRVVKFLQLFDKVLFHATNEIEKQEILKVLGEKTEVRIAVNLPNKISIHTLPARIKLSNSLRLVNIARIAPEKNLLLGLKILKMVKSNVEFDFYGPIYSQEYWNECKLALLELPSNIKANYKGSIDSGSVLGLLKEYHFMFMPTLGENFGHTILQSLTVGCPVIISNNTPWLKLQEKNIGWDLPLEQTEKFAEVIDQCTKMDQKEFDILSKASFDYALAFINNKEIVEQNKDLFIV
jgi:glycosyltransferase involved in cell wall biosynthesis